MQGGLPLKKIIVIKAPKNVLISVFHKEGLQPIVEHLSAQGATIYSTGGTYSAISSWGVPAVEVEDLTSYPSILGGRVKTLHPKVFGGILAREDNASDLKEISQYDIPLFDWVIVDLYPFEQTVVNGAGHQDIIEKIDIGGISLIRAAAKNYQETLVVSHRGQYEAVLDLLSSKNGDTDLEERKAFAAEAFGISSHYDTLIYRYLAKEEATFVLHQDNPMPLRYGENPHQRATFFGDLEKMFTRLSGKPVSYNNLMDIESAVQVIADFKNPTFAIIKHNNTCGLATSSDVGSAYAKALACDSISAFGGILITNVEVDLACAQEIHKLFFEVLISPKFGPGVIDLLKQKKNRILLRQELFDEKHQTYRSMLNGVVVQDYDRTVEKPKDWTTLSKAQPTKDTTKDLSFAWKAVKHLKSNGIAIVKDRQLIGMGCGQTSRVDALKQAIAKAKAFGFSVEGAVFASDAFFPFPDCVEIAGEAGITGVVHPGGSIRDQDSVDMANQYNMSLCVTGVRHFKH